MKPIDCICGGKAFLTEYPEMPQVFCSVCHDQAAPWAKRGEAIVAWNNYQKVRKAKTCASCGAAVIQECDTCENLNCWRPKP